MVTSTSFGSPGAPLAAREPARRACAPGSPSARARSRTRGHGLTEVAVALSLALVLLPAVLAPGPEPLREALARLEDDQARLLLEGELALARAERLAPAPAAPRDARGWPSAARLDGLRVEREVRAGPAGLVEVVVRARWRGRSGAGAPGPRPRSLELAAWQEAP